MTESMKNAGNDIPEGVAKSPLQSGSEPWDMGAVALISHLSGLYLLFSCQCFLWDKPRLLLARISRIPAKQEERLRLSLQEIVIPGQMKRNKQHKPSLIKN